MPKSRYLCSAPRPETWDERAEALLRSLGGSTAHRETMLQQTLDNLRTMHANKQKTGPGRKSNAEHAIAFYEYVLETITEEKEKGSEADNNNNNRSSSASSEESEPEVVEEPGEQDDQQLAPPKRKRGRPRKHPLPQEATATAAEAGSRPAKKPKLVADNIDKSLPSSEVNSDSSHHSNASAAAAAASHSSASASASAASSSSAESSVVTMDTQEFINQHNDLCEVCDNVGDLLMCSTCNLVFHLDCVRPKLKNLPDDDYICAYCVMSGVKGIRQKSSKLRKEAAVAVRAMARMKKQLSRRKKRTNVSSPPSESNEQEQEEQSSEQEQPAEVVVATNGGNNQETTQECDPSVSTTRETIKPQQHEEAVAAAVAAAAKEEEGESSGKMSRSSQVVVEATPKALVNPLVSSTEDANVDVDTTITNTTSIGNKQDAVPKKQKNVKGAKEMDTSGLLHGETSGDAQQPATTTMTNGASKSERTSSEAANATAAASSVTNNGSNGKEEETPRKNNREETPAQSDVKEEHDVEQTPTGRVRRQRKQANYYNPQDGPASHWKSDGANEWKYLSLHAPNVKREDNDKDVNNDDSRKNGGLKVVNLMTPQSKKATKKGSSPGKPWCLFCNDDKNIPVCCFCACRVCFGKHDQSKLLLCDNCDSEYHLSCLDPPLKSVPTSSSWFCPTCVAAQKRADRVAKSESKSRTSIRKSVSPKAVPSSGTPKVNASATKVKSKLPASVEAPVKRGPGRPRLNPTESPPVKRGPGRPRKHILPEPPADPPAKKRGRPPKIKTPLSPSPSPEPESSSEEETPVVAPRKRGRPRKNPLIEPNVSATKFKVKKRAPSSSSSTSPDPQQTKRGPGRPPKNANQKGRSKSPAPRKIDKIEPSARIQVAPVKVEEGTVAVTPAPKPKASPSKIKSRSGRTVKRTSFHDERDEGEQHLKTSRSYELAATRTPPFGPIAAATKVAAEIASNAYGVPGQHIVSDPLAPSYAPAPSQYAPVYDIQPTNHVFTTQPSPPVFAPALAYAPLPAYAPQLESQHQHHHDVDPSFLDSIPVSGSDPANVSHLDALIMDPALNLDAMHTEAMQMDAAMGNTAHLEGGDLKPAITNEVRPAPVVESANPSSSTKLETHNESPASSSSSSSSSSQSSNTAPAASRVGILDPSRASAPTPAPYTEEETTPRPAEEKEKKPALGPTTTAYAPEAKDNAPESAKLPSKPPLFASTATQTANNIEPKSSADTKPPETTDSAAPSSQPARANSSETSAAPAAAPSSQPTQANPTQAARADASTNANTAPESSLSTGDGKGQGGSKVPRRKPGARECMQISRRFGVNVIPEQYMETMLDYCKRGKVEHLIRMRERLDEHSRHLESQLAGLESLVQERGESDVIVPPMPEPELEEN